VSARRPTAVVTTRLSPLTSQLSAMLNRLSSMLATSQRCVDTFCPQLA